MFRPIFILFILVSLINLGCDGENSSNNTQTTTTPPVTGTIFSEDCLAPVTLPSGVNITDIDGDTTSLAIDPMYLSDFQALTTCMMECTDPSAPDCFMECLGDNNLFPDGGTFRLRLVITSTIETDITIQAGTWFLPNDDSNQPMLVVSTLTIHITIGINIEYFIPVYCLASEKSAPSSDDEYQRCASVSSSLCLADIIAITQTKDIAGLDGGDLMRIQDIIWDCTKGIEIAQEDWDFLNGLPAL